MEEDGDFFIPATVTLKQLTAKGELKEQWSIPCEYSFPRNFFLSPDGKTVVQYRTYGLNSEVGTFWDNKTSQAVLIIYREGKIISSFTAKELITDFKKGLPRSPFVALDTEWASNPKFQRSEAIEADLSNEFTEKHPMVFQLTTLEKTLYLFDLKTGKILFKKKQKEEDNTKEDPGKDPFEN